MPKRRAGASGRTTTTRRKVLAPREFPVAYVKYHDHCWIESKSITSIRRAKPYVVEETGFLLHEDPRYVTLAKERSTDGERGRTTYDDVTIIMRSDILDLRIFPMTDEAHRSNGRKL